MAVLNTAGNVSPEGTCKCGWMDVASDSTRIDPNAWSTPGTEMVTDPPARRSVSLSSAW